MDALMKIPGAAGHRERIALLLYPGFTLLDAVGPHHMFIGLVGAEVDFVAKSSEPVLSDTGVYLTPTSTFDRYSPDVTVLCVPGGTTGTLAAMEDAETLGFVSACGARADWVTSVCTGSLLLGAAGLLRGYRATSHWVVRDVLRELDAIPVNERVVRDRNRLTGGGVTAGIDMALTLAVALRGPAYAEAVQLFSEYAPAPPLAAGTPEQAPATTVDAITTMMRGFRERAVSSAQRARDAWELDS